MDLRLAVAFVGLVALTSAIETYDAANYDHRVCFSTSRGQEYNGNMATTADGIQCQAWNTDHAPHDITLFSSGRFPGAEDRDTAQNFCRNPDNEAGGPWCYTVDPNIRWQYCDVPRCFGYVNSVEPRLVGTGGGVRITLRGVGFAKNQFNFGEDSHVGNRVWLVNEYESKECAIFTEGSNEEMITCITPPGMYDDMWTVRLSVDGVATPNIGICNGGIWSWTCSIRAYPWYSAYIEGVVPRSGEADGIITIYGRFFTDAYGSNSGDASNGKEQKILRVYVGGYACELKDGDDFYGTALTWNDDGYIKCKISRINERGLSANYNVSVIIEAPYGQTYAKSSAYHVSATSSLFMYQSYAVINSVSPSVGSTAGGQLITITGDFFDETKAPAEVMVGYDECVVESITDTEILCRTPEQPAETPMSYPGNRGMMNDYHNTTFKHFDDMEEIQDMTPAMSFWSDGAYWCEGEVDNKVHKCQIPGEPNYYNVRSRGYFIPKKSGDYRFYVKADDIVKLYMAINGSNEENTTLIAYSPSYSNRLYNRWDSQISGRFTLEEGKPYYMEYYSADYRHAGHLYIGAKYYGATLVEQISGKVQPEVQSVDISSTEDLESLRLTLTDLSTRSATQEVQTVTMTYSNTDGVWQLAMNGVYTDVLTVDTSAIDLERAINDLPSIYPERVSVSSSEITSGRAYTVTFSSDLGDWPQFTRSASGGASVNLATTSDGTASLSKWRLHMENGGSDLISDMFTTQSPSEEDVGDKVMSLFSARCPRSIGYSASGKRFFYDFEDRNDDGYAGGTIDYASEPFCGRASGMNVARIYNAGTRHDVSNGGHVCFAHRGIFREVMRFEIHSNQRSRNIYPFIPFNQNEAEVMTWNYSCIDILAIFQEHYPSDTGQKVGDIEVYRQPYNDIWVDEVVIAAVPTTANLLKVVEQRRIPLASTVQSVTVNGTAGSEYDIHILPHHCYNNFEMIRVYNAPRLSGSTSTGSTSVTWGDSGSLWPANAQIKIDRSSKASLPVTGTWNLTDGVDSLMFNADESTKNIESLLAIDMNLADVKVSKSGTCYGYTYDLEWTQTSGDLPALQVDGTDLSGNDPTIEIVEIDGHVFYDPLPGDMIVTREENPQVRVTINNIKAKCLGDCSYEWNSANTPTFTDVDTDSAGEGDTLTISGTGFSTTAAENIVRIGTSYCEVTNAAADELTCTLGAGETGLFAIEIMTPDGLATDAANMTIIASISSMSPASGSVGGGTVLELTGSGFDSTSMVYVGGSECEVISVNASTISCMTPAGSDGDAHTYVSAGGNDVMGAANFTYSLADSPNVTDITPTTVSVKGGETLTVTGVQFGDVYEDITLSLVSDSDEVIVLMINETTASDTNLEAELPSLPSGDWSVRVRVDNAGYANDVSGDTISSALRIDAISTQIGSMEGGTRLVIAGEGFGTDADEVEVMVGISACDIDEITNENITCYTGRGSATVIIANTGIDPKFGLGYAWQPALAEIRVGDMIRFQWTSPPFVTSNQFSVMEVASLDAEYDGTGFHSGDPSPTGHYIHQFNEAGTYFYTTGVIGSNRDVELRGKIVVADKEPVVGNVSVTVHGQEAAHNTGSGVSITETVDCEGTADAISGRSETDPSTGYEFEFVYSTKHTPYLEDMDVSQGYIDTDITLTGEGFSTTSCDNEVKIGEYTCVPTSESATEIVCNMDAGEEPDVGLAFPVTLRVNNRGDPVVFTNMTTFALLPSMTSVEPNTGSLNGGTEVNITGAGFVGTTQVMFGLTRCNIVYQTYTLISCITDASSATNNTVSFTVTNSYNMLLPVECANDDCWFEFTDEATPTLTVVDSPAEITETTTTLVVNGTGLGSDTDAVRVWVMDTECEVTDVSDEQVTCDLPALMAGAHAITVNVAGKGKGEGVNIHSILSVDSITPSEGSIWGGQEVTLSGNGMDSGTSVTINSVDCAVSFANETMVLCTTGASAAGLDTTVEVTTSYPIDDDSLTYNYTTDSTPTVTDIDPVDGAEGDEITITGTGFSTTDADNTVMIGAAECAVTSSSATEIICDLGGSVPGTVSTVVNVDGVGNSDSDTEFTYLFTPGQLSPNAGSFGGGLNVSLSATGIVAGVMVTVCGESAEVVDFSATSVTFATPDMESMFAGGDKACDVNITVGDATETMSAAFTYQTADTAQIDEVSPARGGTKGGTVITITGSNFGGNGENEVTVAGAVCDIQSESATEIICETNEPMGGSQKTNVMVQVQDLGMSLLENSDYWYVDVWSSNFTWGGNAPPGEGELVVVPEGQLLLLDESTPVLKMLLILGGELLFDEVDLTLRAENILIVRGGRLTVGTEDAPFQHDATIEMHGQLRAQELPIYGAKCLAVREGELNLHGKPIRMTWTRLGATASAGDTEIELEWGQLDWPVGSTIVIATTGDRHSQSETETRVITAVNSDGTVLTLDEALDHTHLGVTEELGGGYTLEMRAEVGLLSRNVRVIGSRDTQWSDDIEACPEGFDTGEFATQTCFQGRFGDEVGSDQFGAQIMFHAPFPDQQLVVGKLSYLEVTYAGQAFRLGRYPVHFHLNGDMNGSYVRGLAIHETFNRAINVHGTHNMLVEHTVIHNVMGGALFLEDGIETGNSYYYNLALFVKASSSLLNDDITPAAFWATNPANNYEHNAAAGGTHFGWWWRMEEHPTGPSATTSYCPQRVPLGTVYNNTVHSQGWFGLWTFIDYYPSVGGECSSREPEPAKFNRFIVWNCEKGLEFVNAGSLQFHDSLLVNNQKCGLEGKRNLQLGSEVPYTDRGPMLNNTVIAAYAPNYPDPSTEKYAVVLPWSEGFSVRNSTFINFDSAQNTVFRMTSIDGTCGWRCGGWNYHFEDLKFINGDQHLVNFRWLHDGVFLDKDGSYSGCAGCTILPWMETLDPSKCQKDSRFSVGAAEGAVCDETSRFARLSFNNPNMASMLFKDVLLTNDFGTHIVSFADKRLTHKTGWTTVVQLGQKYKFVWENLEHLVNMSYSAGFDDVSTGGVVLVHNMTSKPDRFQSVAGQIRDMDQASPSQLTYDNNLHGDFYFDDNNKEISYIVSDIDSPAARRRKRALGDQFVARPMIPHAYRCFWPDCQPPPDQNTLPPITSRPEWWVWWSNTTIWPNQQLPSVDSDVTIEKDMWVVGDIAFPVMNKLILKGNLELDFEKDPDTQDYRDFTIDIKFLIIEGGRLVVGWEDNRYKGNVEIILRGEHNDEPWPQSSGTSVGNKAIAVYGGLDLHGQQRSPVQTHLAATAAAGDETITVDNDVDWQVGEEITIASTTFDSTQAETVTITAVSDRLLSFTPGLQFQHLGEILSDEAGEREYKLSAEVILVTRNIVVRGGDYNDMVRLGYGGRILVSSMVDDEMNALTGWARISYTQFVNMGQLGYTESFDPRYAIAYSQTGVVSNIKPSYMKGNSFYEGFSPQIGMFGAEGIKVQDNCMYRVVGGGMVLTGPSLTVERNTIVHNVWPGTYNGRYELKNVAYEASFNLEKTGVGLVFKDNIAAGSERAGYRVHGEPCMSEEATSTMERNKAHSCMFGLMMEEGKQISTTCFMIENFILWKNYDYGIWVQTPATAVELVNNALIENGLGVWTATFSPGSLSHSRIVKSVHQLGGYVSGPTQWYDCAIDTKPSDNNYGLSGLARSWRISGGSVGLTMNNADGGSNGQPTHPFAGRMSYPVLNARHTIEDVTIANFGSRTCGSSTVNDFFMTSNPTGDDITHPVYITGATVESSASKENLVYFHRSRVGKVNPSDCVDMDCDGHKKLLVEDMDGSFIGAAGTIIDDAAYEWDGDARYGLGDYRIPKVMLTLPNNTRIDPPPNKGLYRGDDCTWHATWQAYECYGTVYRQVVIENMDADTEVRRLSPIGVKERSGDWIDLLNGPQDHGWCAGYTCQKRISTFWAVLAIGHTYDIYLTGTNPQHTRFWMLHAPDDERVRLAVYYFSPQRLDVFADDTYIYPTNAVIEGDGNYRLEPSAQTPSEWLPALDASIGQNYFDREWQLQYLILKGTGVVDVIIKEVVVVSLTMPPMTIDDFFGENIVNNLAIFLGVPASKIRIVDVVRETSKRKRDTAGTSIQIEIGDAPTSGANISEVNDGDLKRDKLVNLTRAVVDAVQLGTLGTTLNLTILGIDVQEPLPPPENSTDSDWANLASNGSSVLASIQIPVRMEYHLPLSAQREQQPFPTQPEFSMYDANDDLVMILGSRADPWKIRASLRAGGSDASAFLTGNTICGFKDGICSFETLGISHSGSGYIIDFEIFDPASAVFSAVSETFSVSGAQLSAGFNSIPDKDEPLMMGETFTALVDIRDMSSQWPIEQIDWRGHTWEATLSIYTPGMSPDGAVLSGTLTKTFDSLEGIATFDDLSLNVRGRFSLHANVRSSPADHSLTGWSSVVEISSNGTRQDEDVSYNVTLKLDESYDSVADGKEELIEALVYNYLLDIDETARYSDFSITRGSIYVLFWMTGEATEISTILETIEADVTSGLSLTFPGGSTKTFSQYLAIDDEILMDAGAAGGTTTEVPSPPTNTQAIIIAACISAVLVVALVVVIIVILIKKKSGSSKTAPHDDSSSSGDMARISQAASRSTSATKDHGHDNAAHQA